MVFTWGVLEVGPHRHVLRVPHLHPPQELTQRTLSCRRRPQLHQRDTQLEKLSKHHIGLSSHSSCLRFSPSYIFVVNGLEGSQEHLASPAQPVPQPLTQLPPPLLLLHCSLGKFFTQISCWDISFLSFLFPRPVPARPVPMALGKVPSFSSGARPRQEVVTVSLLVPVPHPGHPTPPTLNFPMVPITPVCCPARSWGSYTHCGWLPCSPLPHLHPGDNPAC